METEQVAGFGLVFPHRDHSHDVKLNLYPVALVLVPDRRQALPMVDVRRCSLSSSGIDLRISDARRAQVPTAS